MRKTLLASAIALMTLVAPANADIALRKDTNPFDGTDTFTIGVEAERKSTILVVSCEAGKDATTRLGLMNTFFFGNDPYPSDGDVLSFDMMTDDESVMAVDFAVIRDGQSVVPVDVEMFKQAVFEADQISIRRGDWFDTFDLTEKPEHFEEAKAACFS